MVSRSGETQTRRMNYWIAFGLFALSCAVVVNLAFLFAATVRPAATITVRHLRPDGGVRRIKVGKGETIRFDVVSDQPGEFETSPVIVVDNGLLHIPGTRAAAARNKSGKSRPKARAAHPEPWHGCQEGYFCIYLHAAFDPPYDPWHGPTYTGAGWQDLRVMWTDSVISIVNHRPNADSLMANGWAGNSFRYCAQQHSEVAELINNGFNDAANSIALLQLADDRC